MKLSIKGEDWEIIYLNNGAFVKRFGSECGAITYLDKRKIYFNKQTINLGFIRHELLHALLAECNTESAHLNSAQIEEVCASIVQNYWNSINMWTEEIINGINSN